ncbi:unnamed protein product [Strongylus vulgaris]|uniref:Uncharacterized protein n=1 Tax=Strongylus vulgaris TaxID=40348 RepID=A0A3P7ID99_STRVU|nr:unnamed protein product [Strongylus vulgaris]
MQICTSLYHFSWSVAAFVFALILAFVDWIVLQFTVTIRRVPGCSSFGCFTNEVSSTTSEYSEKITFFYLFKLFRAYWGLSNMAMNLLSCLLTVLILFHLYKRSALLSKAAEIEKRNKSKIDKSANRVALYILLVSALIGVVPGCLNGLGTIVSFKLLDEVSFFVGTCATLSGLSHAFIFGMAHREIKAAILGKVCGMKMALEKSKARVDPSTAVSTKNAAKKYAPKDDSIIVEMQPN